MRGLFFFLLGAATFSALHSNGDERERATQKETVIFDADKDSAAIFQNGTCTWIKDSDLTPQTKIIEEKNSKWLEFSYTGDSGVARSNMDCSKAAEELVKAGFNISGIRVTISYDKDDFGKVDFMAHTQTGLLALTQALKKGAGEYLFTGGFAQQKPDWNLLTIFGLWSQAEKSYAKNFRLQKVVLLASPSAKGEKELAADYVRPVQEIILSDSPLGSDRQFNTSFDWGKLSEIKNFRAVNDAGGTPKPLNVRLGYDKDSLFLRAEAPFPTEPVTKVTQKDMEVWQDEALELFFSGDFNNDRMIQFVINSKGVVMDYLRDFDAVAANVMNNYKWDLPHTKRLAYADGKMVYELAFSLKDLKTDIAARPFIGFNIVQNYIGREADKLAPVKWAKHPDIHWNTNPQTFGFLVLNGKRFGPGEVKLQRVTWSPLSSPSECDIRAGVSLSGFAPGKHTASQWLVCPDFSVWQNSAPLEIKDVETISFHMPKMKNLNGTYTWILGIKNQEGNTKLFAVNFKNETDIIDLAGKSELIWPRPKKAVWAKDSVFKAGEKHSLSVPGNATERTLLTAKLFQEKLLGYAGSEYKVIKGGEKDIVLRIDGEAKFNGKAEKLKSEGYCLRITPDLVEITGADEPGLFYGTVTFMQILKSPMRRLDSAPVKCGEILDWPDLPNRIASSQFLPDQMGGKVEEKTTLDFYLDWIDRFIAGNKMNVFKVATDSNVIFRRCPEVNFNAPGRTFTLDDWRIISAYCGERFIKTLPLLQAGGHDYWLTMAKPELREKGWKVMANAAHPDYFPIYKDCALDIIEATGCEYFSPSLDEWWHDRMKGETPDELLFGKTRDQVLFDFILKLHGFLKERNVKMIIFEDMLNPMHNGRRYDAYKIIDKLPKDIIIAPWAWVGGMTECSEYFNSKGFQMWGLCTGWNTIPNLKTKKLYSGFGAWLSGWWGAGINPNVSEQSLFQWMAHWFRGADYAWNFYQGNECSVADEINSGVFPALSEMFALNPNPCASQELSALDISKSLDASLSALMKKQWPDVYKGEEAVRLPEGKLDIGFIPSELGPSDKNCAVPGKNGKTDFAIKGKFSSLIFLHSALDPKDPKTELKGTGGWRTWHLGWPLGSYLMEYADGSKAEFRVHFGLDIYWLRNRALGGATLFNRYIWTPKDANGANLFFFQSEWVNPHPEKEIVKVSFTDEPRIPVKTAIFAVSGRGVREPSK